MVTAVRSIALALFALGLAAHPGLGQLPGVPRQVDAPSVSGPYLASGDGHLLIRRADGATLVDMEAPADLESPSLLVLREGEGWIFSATLLDRGRRELLLLRDGPDGTTLRIAPPPQPDGRTRSTPVPLTRGTQLEGLAWLEGGDRRSLSVRAAVFTDGAWEDQQIVAPPGAGTQTGLSGAILDDGTWLLAWSAFDGTDDDILVSMRREDTWSAPERAHADNDVPDITPAVVAYRGGARLAWSQFDGKDYRVMLATLRTHRITDVQPVGEPGSVLPAFPAGGGGEQILYRSVMPYGWTLLEIDATARPWRRAQFPDSVFGDRARPAVTSDAAQVTLSWPERAKALQRSWEPVL